MTHKVLVVDDSLASARQLTKLLNGLGEYEVVGHARDGAEGVKMFQQLAPDLVMMDMVMPKMDGLTSLRTVIMLQPKAKVVVVSSMGGVGAKAEEAMRLGASYVISKPFETKTLQKVLDGLFPGTEQVKE